MLMDKKHASVDKVRTAVFMILNDVEVWGV